MPEVALYVIHRLDRRQSPAELAAQLTSELTRTDPRDQLARSRIETARVILGDPQRRARYDRQLDDPSAPEITEQTLAQLSGRPAPTAPSGLFATTKVKVMAVLTVALAIALTIAVSAVACSSGGDGGSTAAKGSARTDGTTTQAIAPNLISARLDSDPTQKVVISGSVDLSATVAKLGYTGDLPNLDRDLPMGEKPNTGKSVGNSLPWTDTAVTATSDGQQIWIQWTCASHSPTDPPPCVDRLYGILLDARGTDTTIIDSTTGYGRDVTGADKVPADVGRLYDTPLLTRMHSGRTLASDAPSAETFATSDADQLPQAARIHSRDGVSGASVLGSVQPQDSFPYVYFVAPDSLRLWIGKLVALS